MATSWKFTDNSDEVMKQLLDCSEEAMEAACLIVEAQAKALAAVSSGELRDKIDHTVKKENGKIIGKVGSPMFYAPYVEYGTGEFAENGAGRKGGWNYQDSSGEWFFTWGNEPQPFLRPAFRKTHKQVEQIIGQKFRTTFKGK